MTTTIEIENFILFILIKIYSNSYKYAYNFRSELQTYIQLYIYELPQFFQNVVVQLNHIGDLLYYL